MTGVAAIPGNHIPVEVVNQIADEIRKVFLDFLIELDPKN